MPVGSSSLFRCNDYGVFIATCTFQTIVHLGGLVMKPSASELSMLLKRRYQTFFLRGLELQVGGNCNSRTRGFGHGCYNNRGYDRKQGARLTRVCDMEMGGYDLGDS